jgi:hypothetical protein
LMGLGGDGSGAVEGGGIESDDHDCWLVSCLVKFM